jgi:hypothetical protein
LENSYPGEILPRKYGTTSSGEFHIQEISYQENMVQLLVENSHPGTTISGYDFAWRKTFNHFHTEKYQGMSSLNSCGSLTWI